LGQSALSTCLVAQADAEFGVPAQIGDYTDFYTSVHHATNIGKLLRPDNPLLPNYKWIPIGYHGRSSSIGISGQELRRPVSQVMRPGTTEPVLAASVRLDYELEMGIFIGPGNTLGEPVPMQQAEQHVFGMCLFNDWSARDVQGWEYQPLGPFLAKNFASTVSPWVVTMEALAPFCCLWLRPTPRRPRRTRQGPGPARDAGRPGDPALGRAATPGAGGCGRASGATRRPAGDDGGVLAGQIDAIREHMAGLQAALPQVPAAVAGALRPGARRDGHARHAQRARCWCWPSPRWASVSSGCSGSCPPARASASSRRGWTHPMSGCARWARASCSAAAGWPRSRWARSAPSWPSTGPRRCATCCCACW
jgi:hypothetical protein